MVSLDDAVLARLEKGGKRYELLVDPELVELFKQDHPAQETDHPMKTSLPHLGRLIFLKKQTRYYRKAISN